MKGQQRGGVIFFIGLFIAASNPGLRAEEVYRSDFEKGVEEEVWSEVTTVVSPVGEKTMLGEFGGFEIVSMSLSDLPEHAFLRFKAKLHILRATDGSKMEWGPDFWTATVRGSGALFVTTFHNVAKGSAAPEKMIQAWPDEYPAAEHPGTTGAASTNELGFTVEHFGGNPAVDATYEVEMSFPHTGGELVLDLGSAFKEAKADESWALSEVVVEAVAAPEKLDGAALEKLWEEVAGEDAAAAHRAVWALVEQGDAGVELAEKKLEGRSDGLRGGFVDLLGRLDSDVFLDRQSAVKELREKAADLRPLIVEEMGKEEGVAPEVRLALSDALEVAGRDVLISRVERLKRVGAFAPGRARAERERERRLENSMVRKDGGYQMLVRNAEIGAVGAWPRFRKSWDYVEDIRDSGTTLKWTVDKPVAGRYAVELNYSCMEKHAGSTLEIEVGDQRLGHVIASTVDWLSFQNIRAGEVEIGEGVESVEVVVRTLELKGYAFFNPASARLVPVE